MGNSEKARRAGRHVRGVLGQHIARRAGAYTVEQLERRMMLSTTPTGLTPAQVLHAYGVDNIRFGSIVGDGTGQTIAIVAPLDHPTALSDLQAFDRQFNLPDPPSFSKVNETGGSTLPSADSPGSATGIMALSSIEWAHAVAPAASILLVECVGPTKAHVITNGVGLARSTPGVSVVDVAFTQNETSTDPSFNSVFTTPPGHTGVTFLAPSVSSDPATYPATAPNVIAVTGTFLSTDSTGNYLSEAADSNVGGISAYETQPIYQVGNVPQSTHFRTVPDVAFAAYTTASLAFYDSYDYGKSSPWNNAPSSVTASCWAGLIAIANQGRVINGLPSLDGSTQTLPRLYSAPATAYHDIISGSGTAGYDLATGRGTPVADMLVPYLIFGPALKVLDGSPSTTLTTSITSATFEFNQPVDPASFSLSGSISAFTGPGGVDMSSQLTGFSFSNGNTDLTVSFNPLQIEGRYQLTIGPNVLSGTTGRALDQNGNNVYGEVADSYTQTFGYDPNPMTVVATTPSDGSGVPLPLTTINVKFSEPLDPSTVNPSNLLLDQGTVTAASVVDSTDVSYTVSGLTADGPLALYIPAGAIKDADENPMLTYSGSLILDIVGTIPFPVPLTSVNPAGSLIYSGSTSGAINPVGDSDTYTLSLDAGQTISIVEQGSALGGAALIPVLTLKDPGGNVIGSSTATAAGGAALLQTIPVSSAGVYTIIASTAASTIGSYSLAVTLNAALQSQVYGGPSNHSIQTAQNIDSSFISLGGNASRGAVLGTIQPITTFPTLFSNDFENGLQGFTIDNTGGGLWHLSTGRGSQPGHSSTTSLYFGRGEGPNGGGNLNSGARTTGTVTSPSFVVPLGAQLKFNSVYQTFVNDPNSDLAKLLISTDGGLSFNPIVTFGSQTANWKAVTVDLNAYYGRTVQLRWSYDTGHTGNDINEGWYLDDIALQYFSGGSGDYYAVVLVAGETLTAALKSLTSGTLASVEDLNIYNSAGTLLESGATGPTNADRVTPDFTAPTTGTYYVFTNGPIGNSYSLCLTKNAEFETEGDDNLATDQHFQSLLSAGMEIALGHIDTGNSDIFQVTLAAGVPVLLSTRTPGDGPSEPINTLNPRLELLNSIGSDVATDDNSGTDGRNAAITYTPATGGTYYVEVSSTRATSTSGDYVLSVTGATSLPFTVTAVTPSDGTYLKALPTFITLVCSSPLDTTPGAQRGRLDYTLFSSTSSSVSGNTITFDVPNGSFSVGPNKISLAPGTFRNSLGMPIQGFVTTFIYDPTAPVVVRQNAPAMLSASTNYTFTVTFADDFALDASSFSSTNIRVTGPNNYSQLATFVSADVSGSGTPRTATYSLSVPGGMWTAAANGTYTVTLLASQVRDLALNYVPTKVMGTFAVAITPAAPNAPVLAASTDSGSLQDDSITNFNNSTAANALMFTVGGTLVGATVTVYADGVAIGSAVASGASAIVTTNGTRALAEGLHSFTARQSVPGVPQSSDSAWTGVTIATIAPSASLDAPSVTAVGATAYTFTVTYSDNVGLDSTSFDNSDLLVAGPNGFSQLAAFVSSDLAGNGSPRTVTYSIVPPGGSWVSSGNGTYAIGLVAGTVFDVAGNAAAPVTLGTFEVNVPVSLVAGRVGDGSAQRSTIRSTSVQFSQAVNFSASSFTLYYETVADNLAFASGAATSQTFVALSNDTDVSFSTPDDGVTWILAPTVGGAVDRTAGVGDANGCGIFADGIYRLVLHGAAISDIATGTQLNLGFDQTVVFNDGKNKPTNSFTALFGDADGNGRVTTQDLSALKSAFAPSGGVFNPAFDFAGKNLLISTADLSKFKDRFLISLVY